MTAGPSGTFADSEGDFNGDGFSDVAMAMQDHPTQRGVITATLGPLTGSGATGTTWFFQFNAFDKLYPGPHHSDSYTDHDDGFGMSMDAVAMLDVPADGSDPAHVRDILVVGAPGFSGQTGGAAGGDQFGAICTLRCEISTAPPIVDCFTRKDAETTGFPHNGDRFGHRVLAANMVARDEDGWAASPPARLEEVVVSAPGRGDGEVYVLIGAPGVARGGSLVSGQLAITEAGGSMACDEAHGFWSNASTSEPEIRVCSTSAGSATLRPGPVQRRPTS